MRVNRRLTSYLERGAAKLEEWTSLPVREQEINPRCK